MPTLPDPPEILDPLHKITFTYERGETTGSGRSQSPEFGSYDTGNFALSMPHCQARVKPPCQDIWHTWL